MPQPETLNVNEAAAMLGIKRTAFYHWRKRVGLQPVASSTASRPRYRRVDVERAIETGSAVDVEEAGREAEHIRRWAHLADVPTK